MSQKYEDYTTYFLSNMDPVLSDEVKAEQGNAQLQYIEEKENEYWWAVFWENTAIISAILSLVSFIFGTFTLTKVVWSINNNQKSD